MNASEQALKARMKADALLLKQRMVLQRLNETAETERHYRIISEAERAGRIAAGTEFPLLFFPCLFEERLACEPTASREGAGAGPAGIPATGVKLPVGPRGAADGRNNRGQEWTPTGAKLPGLPGFPRLQSQSLGAGSYLMLLRRSRGAAPRGRRFASTLEGMGWG